MCISGSLSSAVLQTELLKFIEKIVATNIGQVNAPLTGSGGMLLIASDGLPTWNTYAESLSSAANLTLTASRISSQYAARLVPDVLRVATPSRLIEVGRDRDRGIWWNRAHQQTFLRLIEDRNETEREHSRRCWRRQHH